MALAICAVLWADPAVAELACTATPGCPQHATHAQQASPRAVLSTVSGLKSCCPRHSAPLKAPTDTPACCAAGDTGAVLPSASFLSGKNGPKHALAYLASALFSSAPLTDRSLRFSSETRFSYVRPVDEKKTDLRI
jgi:hypothetical protein